MKKMIIQIISGLLLAIVIGSILFVKFAPQFGARSKGQNLERIYNSPNFREGKFQNLVHTPMAAENTNMLKNGLKFISTKGERSPKQIIQTLKFDKTGFVKPDSLCKIAWFGHSSFIINISGKVILVDPVFSEKASPVAFMGVRRFDYSNQYDVSDMPEIDLVLISHDHYDHLDYQTILKLHGKVKMFYVPLGVAAHLMHWGVPANKIFEFDWWDERTDIRGLRIVSTPARHFSGRAGVDKDYTLWCSWVIKSNNESIYYSGDSGYGTHFKEIGEKFGPFDLGLMECGQYNEGWPYIHMMPEESVKASKDVKAEIMLPVHLGKFNLSLHDWTEPIQRAKKEADKLNFNLLEPVPGEILLLDSIKQKFKMESKLEVE